MDEWHSRWQAPGWAPFGGKRYTSVWIVFWRAKAEEAATAQRRVLAWSGGPGSMAWRQHLLDQDLEDEQEPVRKGKLREPWVWKPKATEHDIPFSWFFILIWKFYGLKWKLARGWRWVMETFKKFPCFCLKHFLCRCFPSWISPRSIVFRPFQWIRASQMMQW